MSAIRVLPDLGIGGRCTSHAGFGVHQGQVDYRGGQVQLEPGADAPFVSTPMTRRCTGTIADTPRRPLHRTGRLSVGESGLLLRCEYPRAGFSG